MTKVFINGTFRVIHPGHVRLIKYAKSLGHWLTVAINSKVSCDKLKGPHITNDELYRKEVLRALRAVDEVIVFAGDNCGVAIVESEPDIIVKGSDYSLSCIHKEELSAAEKIGAKFVFFPRQIEYSSSKVIYDTTKTN